MTIDDARNDHAPIEVTNFCCRSDKVRRVVANVGKSFADDCDGGRSDIPTSVDMEPAVRQDEIRGLLIDARLAGCEKQKRNNR